MLTHAYVHRLADVHLAGFAPAFTLSLCDSEYARKPPVPIASVVSGHSKKRKNDRICWLKNLWRTVRSYSTFGLCAFDGLLTSDCFIGRTIHRRFSKERIGLSAFRLWQVTTENWCYLDWLTKNDILTLDSQTFLACRLKVHFDSLKRKKYRFFRVYSLSGWKWISTVRQERKTDIWTWESVRFFKVYRFDCFATRKRQNILYDFSTKIWIC